jgi:hypothetical protein
MKQEEKYWLQAERRCSCATGCNCDRTASGVEATGSGTAMQATAAALAPALALAPRATS